LFKRDRAETARTGSDAPQRAKRAARGGGPARAAAAPKPGAPPVLLALSYADQKPPVDPAGWWMSEKLDGVRAWWDGSGFVSRTGTPYLAPAWFTAGLPSFPLDGELWLGRKEFQRLVAVVRRQDRGEAWREVRFVVFDAPGDDQPFEQRLERCRAWFAANLAPYASALAHERCRDRDHVAAELARIEALGGEGLMLRQPGSRYQAGRSASLLKVKSFLDAEARVVGHAPGAGKHLGRLGALEVELPNGVRFAIGTGLSDMLRELPPPISTIVTFRYQELSADGVPRFPTFVAVRDDAVWEPAKDAPPSPGT
jgi:DNA ligase-1